ncbi:hypothetical protein NE237_026766 [Protea cynaroides]|uniref:F-box domain-containing protein n=1 Tax=Protea cynaroides TaxID=273540 RepID=A0A9Q0GKF8_9MAGN|nr:hypothetical protein NE237_026766 [Protea cynaroides]
METMEPHKNNKETSDRISHLPEPILFHILSFLSTKDALRTSFLSKSWTNLWTGIPVLDFDESKFYGESGNGRDDKKMWEQKKQFADLIDRSLLLHEGQSIREFKISFHHLNDSVLMNRADPWVRFALINVSYYPKNMYRLPPCTFPSKLLKVMALNSCLFDPSVHKSFPCLETVILTRVELLDTSVQDLIANCPHLESLHLKRCEFPSSIIIIDVPQSQLKHLRLEFNNVEEYQIHVPSLLHFQYVGEFTSISVRNLSKLVNASLEFQDLYLYSSYGDILCELLNAIDHASALTLSDFCLQVWYFSLLLLCLPMSNSCSRRCDESINLDSRCSMQQNISEWHYFLNRVKNCIVLSSFLASASYQ